MAKLRWLLTSAATALTLAALATPADAVCHNNAECEVWWGMSDECTIVAAGTQHCHMNSTGECHGDTGNCEGKMN